jgi:hypothetical protein
MGPMVGTDRSARLTIDRQPTSTASGQTLFAAKPQAKSALAPTQQTSRNESVRLTLMTANSPRAKERSLAMVELTILQVKLGFRKLLEEVVVMAAFDSMSLLGQSRRFGDVCIASALPLKGDIHRKFRYVPAVPEASMVHSQLLAFDKYQTTRRFQSQGRLHVRSGQLASRMRVAPVHPLILRDLRGNYAS